MAESVVRMSNGTRMFGGAMIVGLIGTWVWMLWQSQAMTSGFLKDLTNQRIEMLQKDIEDHTMPLKHAVAQQDGIVALKGRVNRLEEWRETWIQTVPALDAKQNEQLRSLEREVFNEKEGPHR